MRKFRLVNDYGNQAFDPTGVRHGLKAGTVGTLVDEVAAETPGAHNDLEDAYVLEFDDEARTVGDDGELRVEAVQRRVSFAVTDFETDPQVHAAHYERRIAIGLVSPNETDTTHPRYGINHVAMLEEVVE